MSATPLRTERHGPTLVVHLGRAYNSLDEASLEGVENALLEAAGEAETQNLVVDLSATEFFGSRFIESLFRAHNRIKRKGGRFVLSGLQPHPAEVIRISHLDRIWPLFASSELAVQSLAQNASQSMG